jgi:hypothetical protein
MFDGLGWTQWTAEDGLADVQVNCLLADALGQVWAGTNNGLSRYAPRVTGIAPANQEAALPRSVILYPNYPNPFNGDTVIHFEMSEAAQVYLAIYNLLGQRVRTLVDERRKVGRYVVCWDGKDDAGRVAAHGSVSVRKLMLLR